MMADIVFDGYFSSLRGLPITLEGYGITNASHGTWNEITNKPTTLKGYGIIDAMSNTHAAYAITQDLINNWNDAYNSIGEIGGSYLPSTWRPTWSDITNTPTTLAGYGITDGGSASYHNSLFNLDYASSGHTGFAPIDSPSFTGQIVLGTARPVYIENGNVHIKGDTGGWGINYGFYGSSGTDLGGFGAYGGADALIYYYIGRSLDDASAIFYPDGATNLYYDNNLRFATTSTGVSINGNIVATGEVTASTLLINNTSVFGDDLGTSTFSSGFAGSGWKLDKDTDYTLTIDNLIVRGALTAYELDINKINSINGGIVVSVANGICLTVSGTTIYFDEDNGNKLIQFAVNDYIRAQVWTGRGIASYVGHVTAVNHSNTYGSAYIVATTISGTPYDGMELVQIGSSSDTARQNLIYITAADTNNPYIDMLAGVNDGSFVGKQKLRIGNLTGVTDSVYGDLSGYGLYSDNVYLHGNIYASGGTIGGWTIDASTIYTGTKYTSDGYSTGGMTLDSTGALHSKNFYIDSDGQIGIRGDQLIYGYVGVSDTIILSNDSQMSTNNMVWTKLKSITLGPYVRSNLTIRIYYAASRDDGGNVSTRIYRNGTAVGTEHTIDSTTSAIYSEDITGWNAGDVIELYAKTNITSHYVYVEWLRVLGTLAVMVNEITGTNWNVA